MTSSSQRTARAAGLVTGLALAALLVFAMHVPASDEPLGASVRMEVLPPGELDAGADPVLLAANGLVAGEERRGTVALTNTTVGAVTRARARAGRRPRPGRRRSDRAAWRRSPARLRPAGRPAQAAQLPARARRDQDPAGAHPGPAQDAEGYEGRRARISLALRTELTGAMQ